MINTKTAKKNENESLRDEDGRLGQQQQIARVLEGRIIWIELICQPVLLDVLQRNKEDDHWKQLGKATRRTMSNTNST